MRLFLVVLLLTVGCDEAPLFSDDFEGTLNAPASFQVFPGTNIALLSNTNINLQEPFGSLIAYDVDTQTVLEDTKHYTVNFGIRPLIDNDRERILIPDLDRYVRVYSFQIPGEDGLAISFDEEEVTPIISNSLTNAFEADDVPSDIALVETQDYGDIYIVLNQLGTMTIVDADSLEVTDLNDEDRYEGLRITSALTIDQNKKYPARGVSRMSKNPDTGLFYLLHPSSNFVYLFDAEHIENEGVISFLSLAGNTSGVRSVAFDGAGRGYFAHAGLQSILVVDVSQITDNGISFEVIDPVVINTIPLFGIPNEIILNDAQDTAFVSLQDSNEVLQIDLATLLITNRITLSEGRGPGSLFFETGSSELISLDFFSNTLTRMDSTTLSEIEVLP
ncbi:MAG: hypothetical protein KDD46_05925 [Bdellovibrionales bacterium]|nr:hypothetical protein [Bdellovibrionales bacterium]